MRNLKLSLSLTITVLLVGCASRQIAIRTLATEDLKNPPFYYAQQTMLWTFFKVPVANIPEELNTSASQSGYNFASFDGDPKYAYFVLKPMVFTAEMGDQNSQGPGISSSTEVELTALVYPKNMTNPQMTFHDFLLGNPSNPIGQLRLDVMCDNEFAVAAGRAKYHEHKFSTAFTYKYSTINPSQKPPQPFDFQLKAFTFHDKMTAAHMIFKMNVNLGGLESRQSNFGSTPDLAEILYASNPPEVEQGQMQKPVTGNRTYSSLLMAYFSNPVVGNLVVAPGKDKLSAKPFVPVTFMDSPGGKPVRGSEFWPAEVVSRLKLLSEHGIVVGYLLFQPNPVETENGPFEVGQ